MERFEDGVRFQLIDRRPITSGPITTVLMIFDGAQIAISEGQRYFVQAVRTTAHGDDRTQITRKEFMGLEANAVGQLVGIFDNMYGRWCIVRRLDGKTCDVKASDLKMISEVLYKENASVAETAKRLNESKPALFVYTTNMKGVEVLRSDTPITPNSTVSIRVGDSYRSYNVRTVMHRFSMVDGVAHCTETQVILDYNQ